MEDLSNLKRKVKQYQEVLSNTQSYRATWKESLKQSILDQLNRMIQECSLNAEVEHKDNVENLEAIVVNLGETRSGLYEKNQQGCEPTSDQTQWLFDLSAIVQWQNYRDDQLSRDRRVWPTPPSSDHCHLSPRGNQTSVFGSTHGRVDQGSDQLGRL